MDLARRVELIKLDSAALADAADIDLRVRIPTCPDWDMAALVRHILQVHRSWRLIVAEGRMKPDWSEAPMPPDDQLVADRGRRRGGCDRARPPGGASDLLLILWKRLPIDAVDATGDTDLIGAAIAAIDID